MYQKNPIVAEAHATMTQAMVDMGRDAFEGEDEDLDMDDVRALFRANTQEFVDFTADFHNMHSIQALQLYGECAEDAQLRPFELNQQLARALNRTDVVAQCETFGYKLVRFSRLHYWIEEGRYPDVDVSSLDVRDLHPDLFNHLYIHLVYLPKLRQVQRAKDTKARKKLEAAQKAQAQRATSSHESETETTVGGDGDGEEYDMW